MQHIIDTINTFLYTNVFLYTYVLFYSWELLQLLLIIIWIFFIKRYHISGRVAAAVGFLLLFFTMFFTLISRDDIASILSQYVYILFCISFIQEFRFFLKYENK